MNTRNKNKEKIKDAVLKSIDWDARINSGHIEVEVGNGTVTLKGKVNKHMEIIAAEEDAWCVVGVAEVDNELEMEIQHSIRVSDLAVKSGFRNLLNWNVNFDASKIQIEVEDGEMTLSGSVDNYWKKIKLEELAYDMIGIIKVKNNLIVEPGEVSDNELKQAIVFFLSKNTELADKLSVNVNDGIVNFDGEIAESSFRINSLNIVKNIRGVKDIEKNLKYILQNGYN